MKPIKFYAETKHEAQNFLNYLYASGYKIHEDCAMTEEYFLGKKYLGGLEDGSICWFYDEYTFENHQAEEFFFPTPVELPEESAIVSDGLSTSYYQLTITNADGESIECEMGDVIRCVYGDNFPLGNIAKAARRMYEASQGRGKKDVSIQYDANKISYFAQDFAQAYGDKQ